jgi:O-antigen/teichoic acid export membrane protein
MANSISTARHTARQPIPVGVKFVALLHFISVVAFCGFLPLVIWLFPADSSVQLTYLVSACLVIPLFSAVVYGLRRGRRWARYLAIATSLWWAVNPSVLGIAMFMYMIRPEIDRHFH